MAKIAVKTDGEFVVEGVSAEFEPVIRTVLHVVAVSTQRRFFLPRADYAMEMNEGSIRELAEGFHKRSLNDFAHRDFVGCRIAVWRTDKDGFAIQVTPIKDPRAVHEWAATLQSM